MQYRRSYHTRRGCVRWEDDEVSHEPFSMDDNTHQESRMSTVRMAVDASLGENDKDTVRDSRALSQPPCREAQRP